jgi:8-oxo-dGTP pyrophosphatase MutT (NUDIX family)
MHTVPIFTAEGVDAPKPSLPYVERSAVTVLLRNPKNGKILGLRWKKVDWETFVTGGIEENQTPEEAAQAELLQEAGYRHVRLVRELVPYEAKFFHGPKQINRHAYFRSFLFELMDEKCEEVSDEEKANHEPIWLTLDELKEFRLPEGHRYILDNADLS